MIGVTICSLPATTRVLRNIDTLWLPFTRYQEMDNSLEICCEQNL